MSMRTYPAFCTLNQSEPEPSPELEHTTASLPLDQAPHDELLVTRLLDQFRALIEQYKKLEFAPAIHVPPDFQQVITVKDSPPPTRDLTGLVRSRQSPPRTPHACDNCRTSKSKCSGKKPVCSSCQRKGKPCSWTPIKSTNSRLSRKRPELRRTPSPAHIQDTPTGSGQPYNVAQISVCQDIVYAPSSGHASSQIATDDFYWTESGMSDFSRGWSPPHSSAHTPTYENSVRIEGYGETNLASAAQISELNGTPSFEHVAGPNQILTDQSAWIASNRGQIWSLHSSPQLPLHENIVSTGVYDEANLSSPTQGPVTETPSSEYIASSSHGQMWSSPHSPVHISTYENNASWTGANGEATSETMQNQAGTHSSDSYIASQIHWAADFDCSDWGVFDRDLNQMWSPPLSHEPRHPSLGNVPPRPPPRRAHRLPQNCGTPMTFSPLMASAVEQYYGNPGYASHSYVPVFNSCF